MCVHTFKLTHTNTHAHTLAHTYARTHMRARRIVFLDTSSSRRCFANVRHVTWHIDESCHTNKCVTPHNAMWVMSLVVRMSHATHTNVSRHTWKWVVSHVRMCHCCWSVLLQPVLVTYTSVLVTYTSVALQLQARHIRNYNSSGLEHIVPMLRGGGLGSSTIR